MITAWILVGFIYVESNRSDFGVPPPSTAFTTEASCKVVLEAALALTMYKSKLVCVKVDINKL